MAEANNILPGLSRPAWMRHVINSALTKPPEIGNSDICRSIGIYDMFGLLFTEYNLRASHTLGEHLLKPDMTHTVAQS